MEELERLRRKVERQKQTIKSLRYLLDVCRQMVEKRDKAISLRDENLSLYRQILESDMGDLDAYRRLYKQAKKELPTKLCDVCQIVELKPKY